MENTLRVIFPIDEDLQALMEEEAQDTMQVPCKYHASYHASQRFIKYIGRSIL